MTPHVKKPCRRQPEGLQENYLTRADYRRTAVKAQAVDVRRRKRTTEAPPSWLPLFNRVALARNLAQLHPSLSVLVPRLLGRGQHPEAVARDLEQLVRRANDRAHRHLADVVPVLVNECALRGASA